MREPLAGTSIGEFWDETIAESRRLASPPVLRVTPTPARDLTVYDVAFSGFGGQPIAGWLVVPPGPGPFPTVVEYVGHGGGRGYAHEHLLWATAGFAYFVMDVRGQGSEWRIGVTDDVGSFGPGSGAFFTRGIEHRDSYFYRRLYTDGVLAVDAVRTFDQVDADRIAVAGVSQGGGVAIAVAGMREDLLGVMADVPAFGSFRKAVDLVEVGPYLEIARYLAIHRDRIEQTFEVLDHFDTVGLARAARAPALISLGGRDELVPPETIRDIARAYGGSAQLVEYPYNGHEGGAALHDLTKIGWLQRLVARPAGGAQ